MAPVSAARPTRRRFAIEEGQSELPPCSLCLGQRSDRRRNFLRRLIEDSSRRNGSVSRQRIRPEVLKLLVSDGRRGRGRPPEDAEDHGRPPDRDLVAVGELPPGLEPLAVHERPVLAVEVFQDRPRRADEDPRVPAGDQGIVDPDDPGVIAPDQVLAGGERNLAGAPDQPIDRLPASAGGRALLEVANLSAESVAEAMDGPHETGLAGAVADGRPDLDEKARQGAVRNECSRPEMLVDLALGEGPGTVFQQDLQKLKSLGREVNGPSPYEKLTRLGIEHAIPELHSRHSRLLAWRIIVRLEPSREPAHEVFGGRQEFLRVSIAGPRGRDQGAAGLPGKRPRSSTPVRAGGPRALSRLPGRRSGDLRFQLLAV